MTTLAAGESPLHVESLEARDNPAGDVTLSVPEYGLIAVTGDGRDNQFTVSQQDNGTIVVTGEEGTTINGEAQQTFGYGAVNRLRVDGGGGDDRVALDGVNLPQDVAVLGGDGNDQLTLSQVGAGSLLVDAGAGDDAANLIAVQVSGTAVFVGGAGTDVLRTNDVRAGGGERSDFESRQGTPTEPLTNPQDGDTRTYDLYG